MCLYFVGSLPPSPADSGVSDVDPSSSSHNSDDENRIRHRQATMGKLDIKKCAIFCQVGVRGNHLYQYLNKNRYFFAKIVFKINSAFVLRKLYLFRFFFWIVYFPLVTYMHCFSWKSISWQKFPIRSLYPWLRYLTSVKMCNILSRWCIDCKRGNHLYQYLNKNICLSIWPSVEVVLWKE